MTAECTGMLPGPGNTANVTFRSLYINDRVTEIQAPGLNPYKELHSQAPAPMVNEKRLKCGKLWVDGTGRIGREVFGKVGKSAHGYRSF